MTMLLQVLFVVFWGVLFLSILVFVHEGGHYLMARAFGVRVTEFYLGLPCRFKLFVKSRTHGTEFGVTPFLLGGYNRISGMEGEPTERSAEAFAIVQREGRVHATAVAEEMGISVDDAYVLLIELSDLVAIRPYYDPELGEHPSQSEYPAAFETLARDAHFLTEYDAGHDFEEPGSTKDAQPRPLAHPQEQLEVERSHTYLGCGLLKRLAMLCAGPFVNLLLAFVLITGAYMAFEYQMPINENVVGEVGEESLAEEAGLRAGDRIVLVAGNEVDDWEGVYTELADARAAKEDFDVVYERDGTTQTAHIDLPEGEDVEAIGVMPLYEPYHLTLAEAARATLDYAGMVASWAAKLIMPQHTMEVLEKSNSIVGISVMAANAVESGPLDAVALVASVSMSLGFMNLLPIPPLDGGKILIECIGALRRRPLSFKVQMGMSYVGLAFFLFVFVFALRNDIVTFFV